MWQKPTIVDKLQTRKLEYRLLEMSPLFQLDLRRYKLNRPTAFEINLESPTCERLPLLLSC